jgi:DNA-binding CsgD family transcriptional regulator/tetratricopeptide (TPR) repeat protein
MGLGARPEALVEREDAIRELHGALAAARQGRGSIAVITGEAGSGKTSVVHELHRQAAGRPLWLAGGCDPLSAPRPLGPLIDAAHTVDPEVARWIAAGASRAEAFAAGLALVDGSRADGRATVLVVEDVHWADEATLDLVTYLGRRIGDHPALVLLTFRDDEVGPTHPLRHRLGDLGRAVGSRISLRPLTAAGVAQLAAGTAIDPEELHRLTAGNPFFVTEVISDAGGGDLAHTLPLSVRDAVLARAARLPAPARVVLDAAAIVPGRAERWLLDAIVDRDPRVGQLAVDDELDVCVERGLLRPDATGSTFVFRHELARVAIADALTPGTRRRYHERALAALREPWHGSVDHALLAHHAVGADDVAALVEHAPAAARAAGGVGSHVEAANHLESVLARATHLEPRRRAELLLDLGIELMTLGRWEAAIAAYHRAGDLYADLGDVEGQAEALVRCDRPFWGLGRQPEAMEHAERAAALLGPRRTSRAAALVDTSLATGHMLARRFALAEEAGRRAIAVAEQFGDGDILAEACIQSGIALAISGAPGTPEVGLVRVHRGIELADRAGNDHLVTLGRSQIGSGMGELRRYDLAIPSLQAGIEHAEAREIVWSAHYMTAWLARCRLETGEWDTAADLAGRLARNPRCLGNSRFVTLVTLGWLRTRRGDPGVDALLEEALSLARTTGHLQRLWPVAACRAERAWLHERLAGERALLDEVAGLAEELAYPPAIEELAHWRRLAGDEVQLDPAAVRTPFGLAATGRYRAAAERWRSLGCPYEEAMSRFHADTADDLSAALTTFEAMGATPMRVRAAARMRDLGISVPRGPNATTRENPHGLTDRELEVLFVLATGATNREIADELHISVKTVGHHVSNVLAKLGVRTRAEAAVAATRLDRDPADRA